MGDFNIDLLKADTNDHVNTFYNNMTSPFFALYSLQPTRPKSKTVINNILIQLNKPWINKNILALMKMINDQLLHRYCKAKETYLWRI